MAKRQDTVLIADDDPMMRMLLRQALEQGEFRVVEATNGVVAIEEFRTHLPDVILLDVLMPELDGFAVCSTIRQEPGGQNVPILLITGLDDIESINKSFEVGGTDFLAKPINWTLLAYRVRYLLRASRVQTELRESERRLEHAQRIACIGNFEIDAQSRSVYGSREARRITASSPEHPVNTLDAFIGRVREEERITVVDAFENCFREGAPFDFECALQLPNGEERFVSVQGVADREDDGTIRSVSGIVQDITERRKQQDHIVYLAYHDNLTGLPNLRFFLERLSESLSVAQRYENRIAVMFFDLDRFKRINDSFGHSVGDEVLKEFGNRLTKSLRTTDMIIRAEQQGEYLPVARFAGDEFVVLLNHVQDTADVVTVAQRVMENMELPFLIQNQEIVLSTSLGVALYPDDSKDSDLLLQHATSASAAAKKAGGKQFCFYESSMNQSAMERLSLESSLRKALELGEFQLFYQPQVSGAKGELVGVECLIRWNNQERGLVSPLDFIPLLEETGMIIDVGSWILQTAMIQQKAWSDEGKHLTVSINLSVRQLMHVDFVDTVDALLKETGANPELLMFEVTESLLMENHQYVSSLLQMFRDRGIRVSVDDFGTGYSSLSYLKSLPIDELKVDRSFVKDIPENKDDMAIASAIIQMARALHLEVIAEGVENQEQVTFLLEQGCHRFQGYFFGKPAPADQMTVNSQT